MPLDLCSEQEGNTTAAALPLRSQSPPPHYYAQCVLALLSVDIGEWCPVDVKLVAQHVGQGANRAAYDHGMPHALEVLRLPCLHSCAGDTVWLESTRAPTKATVIAYDP